MAKTRKKRLEPRKGLFAVSPAGNTCVIESVEGDTVHLIRLGAKRSGKLVGLGRESARAADLKIVFEAR